MEIPESVLQKLAPAGIYTFTTTDIRSGRIDASDEPSYYAVDNANALEIDDAFRISKHKSPGQDTVSIAIADGSLLAPYPDLIDRAIVQGPSDYRTSVRQLMLHDHVVNAVELHQGDCRPALVIETPFLNKEVTAVTPADIIFSKKLVNIRRLTPRQLTRKLTDGNTVSASSLSGFISQSHGAALERGRQVWLDRLQAYRVGAGIVESYMRYANLMASQWSIAHDIPLLHLSDPRNRAAGRYCVEPQAYMQCSETLVPYTHVTSPLRRPADLVNHLQIGQYLDTGRPAFSYTEVELLAQIINLRTI